MSATGNLQHLGWSVPSLDGYTLGSLDPLQCLDNASGILDQMQLRLSGQAGESSDTALTSSRAKSSLG